MKEVKSQTSYPQVNNVFTDIAELIQTDGDPTIHNHKILLDNGTHNYKIKTNGFLLSPDNLQTTLILQTDPSCITRSGDQSLHYYGIFN